METSIGKSELCMIYMTSTEEDAKLIAKSLVESRLVACANILPTITSIFRWDGKISEESEVATLFKTRKSLFDEVVEQIHSLHSYDCPCILQIPIEKATLGFSKFVIEETR